MIYAIFSENYMTPVRYSVSGLLSIIIFIWENRKIVLERSN